jgi:hypothetical protein
MCGSTYHTVIMSKLNFCGRGVRSIDDDDVLQSFLELGLTHKT